jgi:hypothetical protein
LPLEGHGVVRACDAEPIRHAQDVAVDRQAGHAEGMAEDDVCGLAPNAGKRHKGFHVRWHLSGVARDEGSRCADEAAGLHAEEAGRLDEGFDIFGRRLR